jgi:Peroxisomal biogenesis factor 11 (PEX11)
MSAFKLGYRLNLLTYVTHVVMRIFKPLESLQAALRAVQSSTNFLEQMTTIGRHLAYFGYLSYDMIVWVSRITPVPFLHISNHDIRHPGPFRPIYHAHA